MNTQASHQHFALSFPLRSLVRRIVRINRFLFHPISIFVVLQIVSITITTLWVLWYENRRSVPLDVETLQAAKYDLSFLIAGVILSSIVILGTLMLFVSIIKQSYLNKQQRSFISSVTHELRSPIASMQLSLETMQSRELTKETQNKLHGMLSTDLERLVTLVDQVLVSSRLDRGIKVFENFEPLNVSEFLDGIIDSSIHLDQELRQRVEIDAKSDLEIVTAKPALTLVLSNLLENAVKYSQPETPIKITALMRDKWVSFSVEDQGFGLAKNDLKRIFKIFTRSDLASRKAIRGTGLGLYIVKAVVKILGGTVWAESEGHGLGATFHLRIPAAMTEAKGK